jgi:hypothetical protein
LAGVFNRHTADQAPRRIDHIWMIMITNIYQKIILIKIE